MVLSFVQCIQHFSWGLWLPVHGNNGQEFLDQFRRGGPPKGSFLQMQWGSLCEQMSLLLLQVLRQASGFLDEQFSSRKIPNLGPQPSCPRVMTRAGLAMTRRLGTPRFKKAACKEQERVTCVSSRAFPGSMVTTSRDLSGESL
jgi:hypothetical protein